MSHFLRFPTYSDLLFHSALFSISPYDQVPSPGSYKEANVYPVPQKGDLSFVSNYRRMKYLFNHLHDNNLLSSIQPGFTPGDSTVNQLTFLYNIFCMAQIRAKKFGLSSVTTARPLAVCGTGLLNKL